MSLVRSRLTYANVMATIAVFLALGGGAYAVSLKRNSVGPKQLKTGAVTGVDAQEATFSEVPSAATAANATNAANATSAGLLDALDSTAFQRLGYRADSTPTTTPNVAGLSVLDLSWGAPTVISNLTGGVSGQVLTITTTNTNPDINDAAPFQLAGNWTPALNDSLTLIRVVGGTWIEVSRSDN